MTKGGGRPQVPIGMDWAEDPDYDPQDINESQIRKAYRFHLQSHMGDNPPCKRNCRYNPRCLANLGEKQWFEMDGEDEEELELDDDMVRQDGLPAGLRNLGNTCYVNSFLQIWFHNTRFRQALYDWDPGEDPEEQDNESILDAELYEPKSKIASLQALFAMMQYTKRKYVDPADIICKLGLNPSVQQDAQEFSKLFVSLLEDTLRHQSRQEVRGMIQNQFRGEYAYVTTCLTCKKDSIRPEHFYELDLPLTGNKTLADCLADFLHEEKMTGDERYHCENCQAKQDASRCCKLRQLPPVLNLQLNRFQYDMQLGRKKKLNSNIQFPEELDMSQYLPDPGTRAVYHLTGVLMHVGPDANHGHYIAHIQDLETGNWFKFSDECVVPIAGKSLRLGTEDEGVRKGKMPRTSKGNQNSNNAYMLVYMLQESLMEIREIEARECVKRQSVRRTAVARIQARSRRRAQEERSRMEKEEKDELEAEEENGNVLEKELGEEGKEAKDKPCPKSKKRQQRKLSTSSEVSQSSSIEEVDYTAEYVFSNTRVFPATFPIHLKSKIDRDNQEYDEEQEERHHSRMAEINEQQNKRRTMIQQYRGLRWEPDDEEDEEDDDEDEEDEDESFEFLPTSWLVSYLESPLTAGVIETRHLLCVHNRLDVDKLTEVKLVDAHMASQLYAENGEGAGPRLNHERLCRQCVNNKARLLSLEVRMIRDHQFLMQQRSPEDGTGFWVGKKSYQKWRHLARSQLEDKIIDEVQHWKWQEEARLEAYREEQQHRRLAIQQQRQRMQAMRGRGGARGRAVAREGRVSEPVKEKEPPPATPKTPGTGSVPAKPDSSLTLTDLQAKLLRMGTNVSVAPAGVGGRHGGQADNNTGISVIKNGESFKLANIAEVKLNFSEEDRARSANKPSCAVKPIVQSPHVKPSLAVKPFNVKPMDKVVVNGDGEPVPKKACVDHLVNGDSDIGQQVNGHQENLRERDVKTPVKLTNGFKQESCSDATLVTTSRQSKVMSPKPEATSPKCQANPTADSRTSSRTTSTDSQSSDPKTEDSEVSSQTNKSEESETSSDKSATSSSTPDKSCEEVPGVSRPASAKSAKVSPPVKRPAPVHNGVNGCQDPEETFNSDICCPHGNLRVEQRARQLISRPAWHRLKMYFDNPKTFQFGTPVCSICEEEVNAATAQRLRWREEATRQRSRLSDLFAGKARPEWSKPTTTRVFLLSSNFVMAWRGFVRGLSGGKNEVREPITDLSNKLMVCEEHGGLLYPPTINWENEPDPSVVMVHEDEWREIKEMFNVDLEVKVEKSNTSHGPELTSTPAICEICVANRQEAEAEDRLRYNNQIVFVRRISPDEKVPDPDPTDPEFCTSPVFGESGGKRMKLIGGEVVRRSNRRVKVRGEREFMVHSDMLLRDFKVKLMEVFKVAPYDQNLMVNGEYLTETQKTLGQLKVLPGSLIFLRADEPTAGAPSPTEDWVVQHPEQGFKGTGLLSS